MAGLIAKGYGDALFEIGMEMNCLDQFKQECEVVVSTLTLELMRILAHPKVHKQEKKELLEKIYGKEINHTLLNFMKYMIDKTDFLNLKKLLKSLKHCIMIIFILRLPMW